MNKYCFRIYSIYEDTEDFVYIEAESKKEAIASLEKIYDGEISNHKYLGIE